MSRAEVFQRCCHCTISANRVACTHNFSFETRWNSREKKISSPQFWKVCWKCASTKSGDIINHSSFFPCIIKLLTEFPAKFLFFSRIFLISVCCDYGYDFTLVCEMHEELWIAAGGFNTVINLATINFDEMKRKQKRSGAGNQ